MKELTVFAKERQTKDGKTFYGYLAKITNKEGEEITVAVKFRQPCPMPNPKTCPMNIVLEKEDCNLDIRKYVREDTGEEVLSRTLWVTEWEEGTPYVDTSLDDYDF